jgi:hypothetical protein
MTTGQRTRNAKRLRRFGDTTVVYLVITLCCTSQGKLDHVIQGPMAEEVCRTRAQQMNIEFRRLHAHAIAHCEPTKPIEGPA